MSKPFFSLITPVYNIERLIAKTLQSAKSQTFTDWEMILVDDGSPDKAGEICDAYAKDDSRIKVIHKQNEGLAEARNTGIKECSGEYFIILEGSDLFYDENTLQNIYNYLKENKVDIFFGRLQDMLERGWQVTSVQDEYSVKGLFDEGGKALVTHLIDNHDILALSSPVNKAFRTAFVKDNDLKFYKGIYHDDDEWLPRAIALSNTCFFTDDIIYNALTWDGCLGGRVNDNSLRKKSCDKMMLAHHCCKDIDKRFPNEVDSEFKRAYYEYYVRMYITSILVLPEVKDKECRAQIQKTFKEHSEMFKYARKCRARNLRVLSLIKKFFGVKIAQKLILKRYAEPEKN